MKKYLLTTAIQILLLAVYALYNFFAFRFENVVLGPVKYILPVAIAIIVVDLVVTFLIFKNKKENVGGNNQ